MEDEKSADDLRPKDWIAYATGLSPEDLKKSMELLPTSSVLNLAIQYALLNHDVEAHGGLETLRQAAEQKDRINRAASHPNPRDLERIEEMAKRLDGLRAISLAASHELDLRIPSRIVVQPAGTDTAL